MKAAVAPRNRGALEGGFDRLDPDWHRGRESDARGWDPLESIGLPELKQRIEADGGEMHPANAVALADVDVCVFVDVNFRYLDEALRLDEPPALVYLMREPPSVVPFNESRNLVTYATIFDKVFTWNGSLAGQGETFVEYDMPRFIARQWSDAVYEREKLLANVSSRKYSNHSNGLYGERERVIEYYDRNHPDAFTLYGLRWDDGPGLADLYRQMLPYTPLAWGVRNGRWPSSRYGVYDGVAPTKVEAYRRHRFALCFENMTGIGGYVTEKLWDCFNLGVVPVYWGADDIVDHVPPETFVDYREYPSPAALHERLRTMGEAEYRGYLDAIATFLDRHADEVPGRRFAETVYEQLPTDGGADPGSVPSDIRTEVEANGIAERLLFDHGTSTWDRLQGTLRILRTRPRTILERPSLLI